MNMNNHALNGLNPKKNNKKKKKRKERIGMTQLTT